MKLQKKLIFIHRKKKLDEKKIDNEILRLYRV